MIDTKLGEFKMRLQRDILLILIILVTVLMGLSHVQSGNKIEYHVCVSDTLINDAADIEKDANFTIEGLIQYCSNMSGHVPIQD